MFIQGPSHTPKKVTYNSRENAINAHLYIPEGIGPFPCVVDNHGSQLNTGDSDISRPQTGAFFISLGCAYLFPHRAGYGDSSGIKLTEAVPAHRGTPEHDFQMVKRLQIENEDVIASLNWLENQREIDSRRICCMGSSLGGIHTLLALSRDKRWKCGVNFSGGASQWNDHPMIRDMITNAARKLETPIFLIQPENDFNIAPTKELFRLLQNSGGLHSAAIFPPWGVDGGEAHRFCSTGQQIWGPVVQTFLKKHLLGIKF